MTSKIKVELAKLARNYSLSSEEGDRPSDEATDEVADLASAGAVYTVTCETCGWNGYYHLPTGAPEVDLAHDAAKAHERSHPKCKGNRLSRPEIDIEETVRWQNGDSAVPSGFWVDRDDLCDLPPIDHYYTGKCSKCGWEGGVNVIYSLSGDYATDRLQIRHASVQESRDGQITDVSLDLCG